jgi:hypothetical protein
MLWTHQRGPKILVRYTITLITVRLVEKSQVGLVTTIQRGYIVHWRRRRVLQTTLVVRYLGELVTTILRGYIVHWRRRRVLQRTMAVKYLGALVTTILRGWLPNQII